jgi:2-(3-amino-3-carboxypropyl)histidine synthase
VVHLIFLIQIRPFQTIADGTSDALIFVADGRFHLESAMIANPDLPAYRYNPFDKAITKEGYDVEQMKTNRRAAIASGE